MKSSPEPKEKSPSTTSEYKNLQIKENTRLFNHIVRLSADHDVIVTNTMIKITYKKALKDQNNLQQPEEVLTDDKKANGRGDDDEITRVQTDKKKKYANGLIINNTKVQKNGVKKRFLKSDGKSISKNEEKKKKKVENGEKKTKTEGMKRKASNAELNTLGVKKIRLSETEGKRPIMLVDPDLPPGWSRYIRTKNKDTANEQHVVYVVNPQGKKFRYKWKLRQYLHKTNSTLDPDQFFFGLYPRTKTTSSSERFEDSESSKAHESELENHTDELSIKGTDGREVLLYDPDLPFGWKRVIHSNSVNGRREVHIVSPEGKIFRRRYRLSEYLHKNQFDHDLDKFYFGLYPKKEGNSDSAVKESQESAKAVTPSKSPGSAMIVKKGSSIGCSVPPNAMLEDPNLPEGWKRFIKMRSFGESAGRMEVVIVSPDGRRHRTKKHLQHYLLQKQLNYTIDDFDFTVFGKKRTPPPVESPVLSVLAKKRLADKPVPDLDISSLEDDVITPENQIINTVNGMMICCGLSSARNERKQRAPREEERSNEAVEGCEMSNWVEKLVKLRMEFRSLEPDALTTIANTTKEFVKCLSVHAFNNSHKPEVGLRYDDIAEVVDRTDCLSFLKCLIPKKITYRDFIKLNRPKQFLSFT